MELIEISKLKISSERQRRVFNPDSLGKLAESIATKGLFHALVVQNDGVTLIAGERRSKAINLMLTMGQSFKYNGQEVPKGFVPVVRLAELSPDDAYEAELEENTRRDNLSPQEEMLAIANLHKLRCRQDPNHTMQETAAEVYSADKKVGGARVVSIRDAVQASEYLHDPSVARAKTKSEVVKAVAKIKKREHAQKLAAEFSTAENKSHHIPLHKDAIEVMQSMPAGIVDVICSDPPYGIEAQSFGDMADNVHNYDDSYETWQTLMLYHAREAYRICKTQAHMYLFCDWTRFAELSLILQKEGWKVWPRPLIWNKQGGMLPRPEHGPRYTYEVIIFASKGDKKVNGVFPDVLTYKTVKQPRHAAEKPVEVFEDLLARSAVPGDHVCDFFMGSGVIFPAANRLKLRATGVELNDANFGIAIQRLEEK